MLLSPAQLTRVSLMQMRELDKTKRFVNLLSNGFARRAPLTQAERDVLGYGEVGEQRVVLEHHANIASIRRHAARRTAANADIAAIDLFIARDESQHCRLTAAARAEQRDELPLPGLQRKAVDGHHLPESFDDVRQLDVTHDSSASC